VRSVFNKGGIVETRDTVGKISQDIALKESETLDHTAQEQGKEMLKDFDKNILEAIERGKSLYAKDFYIEVITKKEPLMKNVLRNYFVTKQSCPTPTFDSSVYKYHRNDAITEFLWVVPNKTVYDDFRINALQVPKQYRELLQNVLDFSDGTLLRRCLILNGEIL